MGRACIPDSLELRNHFGTVHGGMLFSVGEVAAASGMVRLLGADIGRLRAITRRATIDYLKSIHRRHNMKHSTSKLLVSCNFNFSSFSYISVKTLI